MTMSFYEFIIYVNAYLFSDPKSGLFYVEVSSIFLIIIIVLLLFFIKYRCIGNRNSNGITINLGNVCMLIKNIKIEKNIDDSLSVTLQNNLHRLKSANNNEVLTGLDALKYLPDTSSVEEIKELLKRKDLSEDIKYNAIETLLALIKTT